MIYEFKYISSDEKNPHDSESSIVFVLAIKINSQWPKVWRKAQTENKAIIGNHRFLSLRASPQIGHKYDKVILIFFFQLTEFSAIFKCIFFKYINGHYKNRNEVNGNKIAYLKNLCDADHFQQKHD